MLSSNLLSNEMGMINKTLDPGGAPQRTGSEPAAQERNESSVQTTSVLQPWLSSLPLMQQTVLLTALRGADTVPKFHVSKYLLRWYRRCVLVSAFERVVLNDPHDPRGGSFTGPIESDSLDDLASRYLRSVDEVPLHFHMHFIHAAEILGYKHPVAETRQWWHGFYLAAVRDLHLHPEQEAELDRRLGDDFDEWQKLGGDGEPVTGRLPRTGRM